MCKGSSGLKSAEVATITNSAQASRCLKKLCVLVTPQQAIIFKL